ncbi:MAG: hypothetical protein ABIH46_09050 [Chloroflexota bacterium]
MSGIDLWGVRSPRGMAASGKQDCVPRLDDLKGRRIGIIDNGFPNAAIVVNRLRQRLLDRFDLSGVVDYRRHRAVGYFEPKELLDQLANECDAVVLGVGT